MTLPHWGAAPSRHAMAIGISAMLHVATLAWVWHCSQAAPSITPSPHQVIQWIWMTPPSAGHTLPAQPTPAALADRRAAQAHAMQAPSAQPTSAQPRSTQPGSSGHTIASPSAGMQAPLVAHPSLPSQINAAAPAPIGPGATSPAQVTEAGLPAASPRTASAMSPVAAAALIQQGRPDYAYNPEPAYPMALRDQGIGGTVWLRVWVEQDGRPGEVNLVKGSGYRLLDEAAKQAVEHWRFHPAHNGQHPLASWVEFPVRFNPQG